MGGEGAPYTPEQALRGIMRLRLGLPTDSGEIERFCGTDGLVRLAVQKGLCGHLMKTLDLFSSDSRRLRRLKEELRRPLIRQKAAALRVHRDGLDVTGILHSEGLRCIPFKGTFLSSEIYGDPLMRRPGDVDLILPGGREDAVKAASALSSLSYRFPFKSPVMQDFHYRVYGQVPLIAEGRATVDLHYAPRVDLPRNAYREMADRCLPLKDFVGEKARMSPLDLLLLLCAHYWTVGRNEHLVWLLDIAMVVRNYRPFSEGWEDRVAAWGMGFQLATVLGAVEYEFGLAPRRDEMERLRRRLGSREEQVRRRVAESGAGALPEGLVRKVHRLGLPLSKRLPLLWRYVWPHPGRIMQEEGERRGVPGLRRRMQFAFRRIRAALRMR